MRQKILVTIWYGEIDRVRINSEKRGRNKGLLLFNTKKRGRNKEKVGEGTRNFGQNICPQKERGDNFGLSFIIRQV